MIGTLPVLFLVLLAGSSAAQQEGNPWWLWIIVFVILVAFVGLMLWWWLRSPEEEAEAVHHPAAHHSAAEAPALVPDPGSAVSPEVAAVPEIERAVEVQEPVEAGPQPVQVDDLEIIEGIGPKIAGVLRDAGVHTFAQLADLDPERLRQILRDRDPNLLRLADPATWPQQARLAANADLDGLQKLQAELRGGRR